MVEIPQEKIAEVRDRIDIGRVVGRTVSLTRRGKRMVGRCPFHNEKTPSFGVDTEKKLFHCFGCQVGGDVFHFVMRMEGLDFPTAVRTLAKEAGVVIEERPIDPREKEARDRRERLFGVNRTAQKFFARALQQEPKALAYFRDERGLTEATLEQFGLGWAPDGWQALTDHLAKSQVPADFGVTLGLLGRSQRGTSEPSARSDSEPQNSAPSSQREGRIYDRLRGRLIFPIQIPGGEVAGFGARRADWIDKEGPKYLNSQESPVYDKSSILYGLDRARDEIRKARRAILVEGYLDVILLHQTGLPIAIAACGTALSARHAAMLRRLTPEVVTMYDGDDAGIEATRKSAEMLLAEGLQVRVATLPTGEDPDTFARKHGTEGLNKLIDAAPGALDHFVQKAKAAFKGGGIAGVAKAVESVKPLLSAIVDPLARDVSIDACARAFGLEPHVLRRHLVQPVTREAPNQATRPATPPPRAKSVPPPVVEMALLQLFVESPDEVIAALEDHDAIRAFSSPAIQAAIDGGLEALRAGTPFDVPRALEAAEASGHADEAILVALRKNLMEPRPERDDVVVCVKRLLRSRIDITVRQLLQRLAKETDPGIAESLAMEVERLNRQKATLS